MATTSGAPSEDELFGLYSAGLVSLAKTARLMSPEQANCERPEAAFQPIKRVCSNRINFHLRQAFEILRRHLLAHRIEKQTNSGSSESDIESRRESRFVVCLFGISLIFCVLFSHRIEVLYRRVARAPASLETGSGEARHFTPAEVHSPFFVIMWLHELPDYVIGNVEHPWFLNDNGDFSEELSFNGRAYAGCVKGVTVLCDYEATCGAVLYDAAWTTPTDLEGQLLEHTKVIVANPGSYSIPGWKSVQCALDFLVAEATRSQGANSSPLRSFLVSAGVAFPP